MKPVKKEHKPAVVGRRAKAEPERRTGFLAFIRAKEQRWEVMAMLLGMIGLYGFFWWCYPMPFATADSSNYVYCAMIEDYGGYRPEGFSWLLRFAHLFGKSFNTVGILHLGLYAWGAVLLAFTIKRFFPPRAAWMFWTVLALLVLNPAGMYMTRWTLSDPSNLAFTMLWAGSLFWLLYDRASIPMMLLHALAMFLAIKMRYSSMILPLISLVALLMRYRVRKGWYLALLSVLPALAVVTDGMSDNKRLFEIKVFSGFSGWAQANNLSAILPHIRDDKKPIADPELRGLHKGLLGFSDTCYTFKKVSATNFIWKAGHPGKAVLMADRRMRPNDGYVRSWVRTGVLLGKYASMLRWRYPGRYIRWFLLPNLGNVFDPPVDFREYPVVKVDENSQQWFGMRAGMYSCTFDAFGKWCTSLQLRRHQVLITAAILVLLGWFWRGRGRSVSGDQRAMLGAFVFFLVATIGFLVVGHPVLFRYVVGFDPYFILLIYALLSTWPAKRSAELATV